MALPKFLLVACACMVRGSPPPMPSSLIPPHVVRLSVGVGLTGASPLRLALVLTVAVSSTSMRVPVGGRDGVLVVGCVGAGVTGAGATGAGVAGADPFDGSLNGSCVTGIGFTGLP